MCYMKTLLIPIDFSEISDNALLYGVRLANALSANIILLHVNPLPVYNSEYNTLTFSIIDALETSLLLLKEKAERLKSTQFLKGSVTYFAETGDLKSHVIQYNKQYNVDLIVMGITGHDTKFTQTLFGSNAVSLSKESKVPILIIPKGYTYKNIQTIAYACDYDSKSVSGNYLTTVKQLCHLFDANLNILHVIPENHLINEIEAEVDLHIEKTMEQTPHKTYILLEDSASEAVIDFVRSHDVDIILLQPEHHSFWHRIFHTSTTKEVAFESPVPILCMEDGAKLSNRW